MRLLGTTITPRDAARDLVLAGGFTSLVLWAAVGMPVALVLGFLGGGWLGIVLHLLPPEPQPGDRRSGRIILRVVSGALGGAYMGGTIRWLLDWAGLDYGTVASGVVLGALAGAAWYLAWGLWETRAGRTTAAAPAPARARA